MINKPLFNPETSDTPSAEADSRAASCYPRAIHELKTWSEYLPEDYKTARSLRLSTPPRYDSVEDGYQFTVETRINGELLKLEAIPDPLAATRVRVGFWGTLRSLFRGGVEVEVLVSASRDVAEAVLELDNNYRGDYNSTRRAEFDGEINRVLESM